MSHWAFDSIFYHIYPLGFCGAPERNDFTSQPVPRLNKINSWLDHIQNLGSNAIYLGPIFESTAHGYDTADYFHVDRRLGTDDTLNRFSAHLHQRGIRLILDGVFNHVGRDFWAFRDVQQSRINSKYCEWFEGLRFDQPGPYRDGISYTGWNGNYDLVKLNLRNPEVKKHLFLAIESWVRDFDIDGLRLDVADQLDHDFLRELHQVCRQLKPDFWLMGESVHGDYRRLVNSEMLDSVTNYESFKGLYSSLVENNYFEIAYALNRQFGQSGIYTGMPLYNFVDNHDVNRVASNLHNPAHLYPLYLLLFTMPGVPSVYYGSEWGITGTRTASCDQDLRPCLDLITTPQRSPNRDLASTISQLSAIRQVTPALRYGDYQQLFVSHEQMGFSRTWQSQTVFVLLNAADEPEAVSIPISLPDGTHLRDVYNHGEEVLVQGKSITTNCSPCWGRIFVKD